MNDSLGRMVTQIRSGAESIAVGAGQVAAGNQSLSSRTEQHASSLEETASTLEEFATTVKQNAEDAKQASALAASASTTAQKGGGAVSKVVVDDAGRHHVLEADLGHHRRHQRDRVPDEPAGAERGGRGRAGRRAGPGLRGGGGRGAQPRAALRQRGEGDRGLIKDSVGKVEKSTDLVEQAGKTMDEMVECRRVAEIITEIASASQEQKQGINQINNAITEMDNITQQNASLVEEHGRCERDMANQAAGLARSVAQFRVEEDADATGSFALSPAAPAPRHYASASPKGAAVAARSERAAAAGGEEEWKEF